ncbi:hypothetical protein OUZ56_005252 [Daphnia magna]|uniref:Uncharacterized protein n=1 Tax=Daphnia magna TaxID=35525 RepID=A0ABQ9YSG3_9CRUS|nr:hypothetical protein OUZ56_005252 [Daphnia magna]
MPWKSPWKRVVPALISAGEIRCSGLTNCLSRPHSHIHSVLHFEENPMFADTYNSIRYWPCYYSSLISLDVKNSFDMHRKPIRGPEIVTLPLPVKTVFDVKNSRKLYRPPLDVVRADKSVKLLTLFLLKNTQYIKDGKAHYTWSEMLMTKLSPTVLYGHVGRNRELRLPGGLDKGNGGYPRSILREDFPSTYCGIHDMPPWWSQTIGDIDVFIPVTKDIQKAKQDPISWVSLTRPYA